MIKHLQKIILAAAMLFFAHSSWAYDFYVVSNGDTIYYTITSNTSPYTVAVTRNINSQYSGSVTIPSSVTYNGLTFSVTRIEDSAFYNCTGLTSITIPNSVTSIGRQAFYSCTVLTRTNYTGTIAQWCDIDFGSYAANPIYASRNLYINNQLITNLVIPNTIDTIKQYAFYGDTCITSVTIPNSVTSIGNSAFNNCTGLTSVNFNADSCVYMGSSSNQVFYGCNNLRTLNIGNNVKLIPDYAFYNCTGLTSITIPNSVTIIGNSAFNNCTGLTSITIPNSVTIIGRQAFYSCTVLTRTNYTGTIAQWCDIDFGSYAANPIYASCNLYINNQLITNLVIPNTIDTIKQYAFYGDTCITSVTIPNSVTSIGESAFYNCVRLDSVTIGNSVTSIGNYAFSSCSALTSVAVPDSVASIGSNAFSLIPNIYYNGNATGSPWGALCVNGYYHDSIYYADSTKTDLRSAHKKIHSAAIPNSVTRIGNHAFYNCTGLTSVTIPNSVTSIGAIAFYNCASLDSVAIGNSVTSIGNEAFSGCYNLTSITFPDSVASIGSNAFSLIPNIYYNGNATGSPWGALCVNGYYYDSIYYTDSTKTDLRSAHKKIHSVSFPNSVTRIGNSAFYNCVRLDSVTIGNSVTSIGNYAFYNCTALTSVTFRRTNTSIGTGAFSGVTTSIPIYIPCNSRGWYVNKMPNFTNFIEELQYTYSVSSQDTTMGTVATITAPLSCNTPLWTVRANANTGYTFSRWSDGDTNTQRTLTVTQDTTLVAYFTANTPQWYRFSVVSEDTLKGTVQIITQPSQANPQATFEALPNTGYTFSRWSDGNTQNPRSLTVTQDTTLVAYFTANTPQWYRFSVVSEDTLKGTVQIITQPSQANPQATFEALPNTGYIFSRWSDGNTQNPRSITVTQDTIFVAYFDQNQGIVKADGEDIKIYPNPASETVTITGFGNNTNMLIVNVIGKIVKRLENVSGSTTFNVGDLPKGIYFVRVGNAVRKLVID